MRVKAFLFGLALVACSAAASAQQQGEDALAIAPASGPCSPSEPLEGAPLREGWCADSVIDHIRANNLSSQHFYLLSQAPHEGLDVADLRVAHYNAVVRTRRDGSQYIQLRTVTVVSALGECPNRNVVRMRQGAAFVVREENCPGATETTDNRTGAQQAATALGGANASGAANRAGAASSAPSGAPRVSAPVRRAYVESRSFRDSFGNNWIEFVCPDGSGGVLTGLADLNRDGTLDCRDHLMGFSPLGATFDIIGHTARNSRGPRAWNTFAPVGPGDAPITSTDAGDGPYRLALYASPEGHCIAVVSRSGELQRDYDERDPVNLAAGDLNSEIMAGDVLGRALPVLQRDCTMKLVTGWGRAGAVAARAAQSGRFQHGWDGMGVVFAAPFVDITEDATLPFVWAVNRGAPDRLTNRTRTPRLNLSIPGDEFGYDAYAAAIARARE